MSVSYDKKNSVEIETILYSFENIVESVNGRDLIGHIFQPPVQCKKIPFRRSLTMSHCVHSSYWGMHYFS